MPLTNKKKELFTDLEGPLEDRISLVMMEIATSLLTEADQLVQFNAEIGTCALAEAGAGTHSEEAGAILEEAEQAATRALRERFPSVPETLPHRLGITI